MTTLASMDGPSSRPTVRLTRFSSGRPPLVTRRGLRLVLAALWLLDGALQLQSFMFSTGFAKSVIAPAASGQPAFVAAPVEWNAHVIASHPVLFNGVFASVQLLLGLGFLFSRTARLAVVGTVIWSLGVWYLGEGLGGLGSGDTTLFLGAPGAAVLYAVLALAAWPPDPSSGPNDEGPVRPPRWIPGVWAALWIGFAVLTVLPGNGSAHSLSDLFSANASTVPSWLGGLDRGAADVARVGAVWLVAMLVLAELAVGLSVLARRPFRDVGLWAGVVLAGVAWATGQSFGQLLGGQATDPNTGPLVVVLGLAALAAGRAAPYAATSSVTSDTGSVPPPGSGRGSVTKATIPPAATSAPATKMPSR